jgi:hypothetical protein
MCSLPQCVHETCGSAYRVGTAGMVKTEYLDRDSFATGSVVERGKAGAESMGGVPWFDDRRRLPPAESSLRREPVGGKGVAAGVELKGSPTTATELVGLALGDMFRPSPRSEVVVGHPLLCKLVWNC